MRCEYVLTVTCTVIMTLFVYASGLCSVANEPPFHREGSQRAYLRQKLDAVMTSQHDVWTVYLAQNGDRYSATFNVCHETSGMFVRVKERQVLRSLSMIMPTIDFLRNHALKGYKLMRMRYPMHIINPAFRVYDNIAMPAYRRCSFYSMALQDFLEYSCPKLIGKGKVNFDCSVGKPFSSSILRSMIPFGRRIEWSFVDKEKFLEEIVVSSRGKRVVFMAVPGTGVLRGCMQLSLRSIIGPALGMRGFSGRSLYAFKLLGTWDLMEKKYRYSQDQWMQCINFPLRSKREGGVLQPHGGC